jgi:hypothetical protein
LITFVSVADGLAKKSTYLAYNPPSRKIPGDLGQRQLSEINVGSSHETSVDDAVLYSNAESLYSTPTINFNPGDDNYSSLGIGATDDHYSHLEGMVVAQAAPSLYDRLDSAMIQFGRINYCGLMYIYIYIPCSTALSSFELCPSTCPDGCITRFLDMEDHYSHLAGRAAPDAGSATYATLHRGALLKPGMLYM